MKIKEFTVGDLKCKSYIISQNGKALIIDPGAEGEILYNYLQKNKLKLQAIINTHGHFDHIGANDFLKQKTEAKILAHPKAELKLKDPELNLSKTFNNKNVISPSLDKELTEGQKINFEGLNLKIIYTPGHSEDGISIYIEDENILFSGDCIFAAGIGRTDLGDSNFQMLKNSVEEKLFKLPADCIFYAGHGSESTISAFKNRVWPAVY